MDEQEKIRAKWREQKKRQRQVKCMCGCGEVISEYNRRHGYWYVDETHEKKAMENMRVKMRLNEQKRLKEEILKYCYRYDATQIKCVQCIENRVAKYRDCYEEPIIKTKVHNEM